jgi:Holliday junction resolvase RusA-like endonuclease
VTVIRYTVPGRPVSWQRANIVNGRPTTDKKQRQAKALHAMAARVARPPRWDLDTTYRVEVNAYYPDNRLGDTDRILSLPMDALEGVAYRKDRQVAFVVANRFLDKKNPRTEVRVEVIE